VAEQRNEISWVNGLPVVRPPEELDATNADALRAAILAASDKQPDVLVVDLSATAFCDSTGLSVLVRAHKQLDAAGAELRLVIREPTLLRIFTITGVSTMFRQFATLEEALASPAAPTPAVDS
jgi:anti-anti-sigma factor